MIDKELLKRLFDAFTPNQHYEEVCWLIDRAKEIDLSFDVILEIGITLNSAIMWSSLLNDRGLYIGLDADIPEIIKGKWPFMLPKRNICLIEEDSHDKNAIKLVNGTLEKEHKTRIDLLYIDGDHTYNGVKTDFDYFSPFVKKGGIIAFHDIYYSSAEVDVFFRELNGKKDYCVKDAGIGIYYKEK